MAWPGGSHDAVELPLHQVSSSDTLDGLTVPVTTVLDGTRTPVVTEVTELGRILLLISHGCNNQGFPQSGSAPRNSIMLVQILIMMYIATCLLFYVAHVIDYYFTVL